MTDETLPDDVATALSAHDAFEPAADGYALSTTVFDVRVTATETAGDRAGEFTVEVSLPTLSAAVVGEVADVVETDWVETFERRIADAFSVANAGTHDDPAVERSGDTLSVRLTYEAWDATEGVEDAKALAEFVEGTYAQGLIPGYEYRGAANTLRANAHERGGTAAEEGGTPL
ncbi:DUF5813 family protein [Halovivax limisalsi]|uniref:DUF5813 family protein n=1 Tax=Halovivax limisalsi TaxID=1453760 RepID=UPI001FFD558C|nr:DUF5813 family protein [Halovivax limisalsi]